MSIPETKIVIWHIGGSGGVGPVTRLLQLFPRMLKLVLFDARADVSDAGALEPFRARGMEIVFVNRCVGGHSGPAKFFVNTYGDSSSLLPPSRKTADDNPGYPWCKTWGENCALDRVEHIELHTIDDLVAGGLPAPDLLSIDAQGAELSIFQGGAHALREGTVAIVSEVEYYEIYEGQGLFADQLSFLDAHHFRLADVFGQQFWHMHEPAGDGFLTVGEALFFKTMAPFEGRKDPDARRSLMKLAVIAYAFNRISFCRRIIEHVDETFVAVPALDEDARLLRHVDHVRAGVAAYYRENIGVRPHATYLGDLEKFTARHLQAELVKRFKWRFFRWLRLPRTPGDRVRQKEPARDL